MSDKEMWSDFVAVPRNFAHGFLGGLFGPIVASVAVVGMVYLATKQLPAIKDVTRNDGSIHRAITLAAPLEARASWARHVGELRAALLEIRARGHR